MVWPGFEHLHVDRVCIAVTTGLMKALGFIVALLGITHARSLGYGRTAWTGRASALLLRTIRCYRKDLPGNPFPIPAKIAGQNHLWGGTFEDVILTGINQPMDPFSAPIDMIFQG